MEWGDSKPVNDKSEMESMRITENSCDGPKSRKGKRKLERQVERGKESRKMPVTHKVTRSEEQVKSSIEGRSRTCNHLAGDKS